MFEKISFDTIKAHIKNFIYSERAILLLCMSIALIFWLIIQLSKFHETTVFVTLNIKTPPNLILKKSPPKELKILVASKGWNLFSGIYRKRLKSLSINVIKNQDYNYRQIQQILQSKISNKIEIKSIYPSTLSFELDEFAQKKVAIKANTAIETINQFQLSNKIQLLPDSIEISGPKSLVDNISSLKTKEIQAKNLKENRYGKVGLLLQKNKQVQYQSNTVNYIITVEQFSEKTLIVPIKIENDTTKTIRLIPQMANVTCTIGLTKYEQLKSKNIELSVDFFGVNIDEVTKLPVIIKKKPTWISNVKVSPELVDFVIITSPENSTDDE